MADRAKQVGEVLGILGVIGSLAFVALEVRQNTAAVRGATVQAVSQQSLDLAMAGLNNPDIRAAFIAAYEAANPEEIAPEHQEVLSWFLASKLRADENRFRQVQLGTLDASTFSQLGNNRIYQYSFFGWWWARNGAEYAADFQEVVEREFLPLSGTAQSR